MRITSEMLSSNFLYDLGNNLNNMQTYQQQMASGNLINKASDNPLGTSKVMNIDAEMSQNQQYNTNITDTTKWLSVTDSSLGQINGALQRINELLVSSGNAAYGSDELGSIKDEINQNVSQLSQLINTNYGGKYIFGGTRYDVKPTGTTANASGNTGLNYLDSDGITAISASASASLTPAQTAEVSNINSSLVTEISQGVTIGYNVTAGEIIQFTNSSGTSKNLSDILNNITTDLGSATTKSNLTGSDLTDIQDAIKNISTITTKVGAQENRMTSAATENESENTSLTDVLSATDDVDYAQASMNYAQAQTLYQASLQTSAKILQKSLLDYL